MILSLVGLGCVGPSTPTPSPISPVPDVVALGPEWDHCPGAEVSVGDPAWTNALSANSRAVYCSTAMPGVPLSALLQSEFTRLRVVAGRWPVPSLAEDTAFGMPICTDSNEVPGPTPGTGTVSAAPSLVGEAATTRVSISLPFGDATLQLGFRFLDSLDGHFADGLESSFGALDIWDDALIPRAYLGCERLPNQCDFLELDRGEISLDQVVDTSPSGQARVRIVRARGQFGGVNFDMDRGENLIVSYGDVLAGRDAYIWFYAPLDGACGLELREYTRAAHAREIWTVACDGTRLELLEVTEEFHNRFSGCG